MNKIIIKEVVLKKDLKKFILFPYSLYKNNPYWVPPIQSNEIDCLEKTKNPAFEYCEAKYWLAYKDDIIVGRIAGIINKSYIEKWKNKYARFGWIDFINDLNVSKALIKTVEDWAKQNKLVAVHGPLGFTDFDPEGMLIDGFNVLGTMTTIYNYSYYSQHLEKLGYKKDVDWLEYEINITKTIPERIERLAEIIEKRYKVHSLKVSQSKDLIVYAKAIFELLNETYKDLYGVVKLTEKQINNYIKQYFSFIQYEYVSVVLDENENVVAFAISIPSMSIALQKSKGKLFPIGFYYLLKAFKKNDTVDLYLVAVKQNLQGKGLNAILIRDLIKTFIKKNITKAITHPALEENNKVQALWKSYDAKVIKRRRCYIKELTSFK